MIYASSGRRNPSSSAFGAISDTLSNVEVIDRRSAIARGQRHGLLGPAAEDRIGADEDCAGMQFAQRGEGGGNLTFGGGPQDRELYPSERAAC
jgi:hypothetical protein